MALLNTAGTPIKAILDGVPYELMADCNPSADFSDLTVEANATSGMPVYKYTKKVPSIKGIDVRMSIQQYAVACQIKAASAGIPLPQGLMYADHTVVTFSGRSNFGEHSGADGKMSAEIYFDAMPVAAG